MGETNHEQDKTSGDQDLHADEDVPDYERLLRPPEYLVLPGRHDTTEYYGD